MAFLFAIFITLPADAINIALSGTVTNSTTGAALPGVEVSLASGGISTRTTGDGSWTLAHQDATSIAGRSTALSAASPHSARGHRIVLRYRGRNILGHADPEAAATSDPVPASGRSVSATGMVDTLLFAWSDSIRTRLPIASYVQSGITTSLDTSTNTHGDTIPWNTSISYGALTDSRDGQVYRTVIIGTQTWMAQNLNFDQAGVCYLDVVDSCSKYGRLYTWSEVMKGATSSKASPSGVKGICPTGWHVPSDAEWTSLTNHCGAAAGTKLKSVSGWTSGNGTDVYGFRMLPAGSRHYDGTSNGVGSLADFWTATEYDASWALDRYTYNSDSTIRSYHYAKTFAYSLRCVQDIP